MIGQTQWIGRAKGAYLYIAGDEVVYANQKNVHLRLIGAKRHAHVEGLELIGGISSYFTGRDEKTWFTGIPHYSKLKYTGVYPGIDIVYYGSGRNIEYDFILRPGANPEQIQLAFSEAVTLDHGDLIVAGLRQHKPRVLQEGRQIAADYRISGSNRVQVTLAKYDRTSDLIIDPVLEFSTYIGGPGADEGIHVLVDSSGAIYLTGFTQSPASPSLNPFQQTNIVSDAPFVMKMTPLADHVVYFAVLGSNGWDSADSMAVDSNGGVVVVGTTRSATFPLKNPIQPNFKSAFYTGFVTKLSPDARSLVYSTYFGGSYEDGPSQVQVDSPGNAYLAGFTGSSDFPVLNALQPKLGGVYDGYVAKISPAGSLIFSTFLGGSAGDSCSAILLQSDGNLLIVGSSASTDFPLKNPAQTEINPLASIGWETPFLVRISPDGQTLLYSSFIGGPAAAYTAGLALDPSGNIYVAGWIHGSGLTTKNAFQNIPVGTQSVFFLKLDPSGKNLIYSSYLGGTSATATGVGVDPQGSVYVAGLAESTDFPTKNSLQPYEGGGIVQGDFFIAKFAPSGNQLVYSTLLGGSNNELGPFIFVDASGNVYGTGQTASEDFPTKNAYQPTYGGGGDAVLFKISDSTVLPPSPLTVSPGHLSFSYLQGASTPSAQAVTVTGGSFTATGNMPWISVTQSSINLTVSVNPAALAHGIARKNGNAAAWSALLDYRLGTFVNRQAPSRLELPEPRLRTIADRQSHGISRRRYGS